MDLRQILLVAPILLFSMVAHEYAHGYAALRQGDPTARDLGRLTFNPVKHIDPMMTVLLPLLTWFGSQGQMMFGGAKPIPVDPRNYRHYRRGDVIVSLAGIATNLLLAFVCTLLIVPFGLVGRSIPAASGSFAILQLMMLQGIAINLVLAFFNLLPIPPLDGSHVVKHMLPRPLAIPYVRLARYGILVLMLFLWFGRRGLSLWMRPAFVLDAAANTFVAPYLLPQPPF